VNGVVDFAGTDATFKSSDPQPPKPLHVLPDGRGTDHGLVQPFGSEAEALARHRGEEVFSGAVTTWDDAAIKTDNPSAKLPSTKITGGAPERQLGHHGQLHSWLNKAAPTDWTLGTGSTISWGSGTQGATGNSGVAKLVKDTDGAVGYVDFSDANASDLTFASIKNSSGKFITPNLVSAEAAAQGATVNADLTFDPINATGPAAYPITSPTWIIVYTDQSDANKGAAIKGFLSFIYGDGQKLASQVDYARLPKAMLKQAKAQVNKIVVPAILTSSGKRTGRVPPARPVPPLLRLYFA